jgi:hypothetical protein
MRKILVVLVLTCISIAIRAEPLTTIGWVEMVKIEPERFEILAKIDTGADNSSLDVTNWETYMRNGSSWIRFDVMSNEGRRQQFERPLERYVRIKRKQTDSIRRPVVKMWLCIGNEKYLASVSLSTRDNFKYRMLIGRSFLKNRFLVDSAKRETLSPKCNPSN